MKILGDDAPQHILQKLNADSKPWYLRPNYDQLEILMDPDGAVRAGTPSALVERLTAHEHGGVYCQLGADTVRSQHVQIQRSIRTSC